MKEITYEEWIKNPTPRLMWVWDEDEELKVKRKVIYVLKGGVYTSLVLVVMDECVYETYQHCAEIEEVKTRRMTKKELSRWLREKPTREFKYDSYITHSVCSTYTYNEDDGDEEVRNDIVIREDYGEWKEPLVEIE